MPNGASTGSIFMKQIANYWELRDFCLTHGRVVPHLNGSSLKFTRFHCEDSRHDPCNTIICSEAMGTCEASMVGILTMQGYVVEFVDDDNFLFCTSSELKVLKEESEIAKKQEKVRKIKEESLRAENPARPRGLTITRADMVIEYKAYEKCLEYPLKMMQARALGYLTPPYYLGDSSYTRMLCKDDCIFCHCPFYSIRLLEELRHNHRNDYDEWVVDYIKKFN